MSQSDFASRLRGAASLGRPVPRTIFAALAGLAAFGVANLILGSYLGAVAARQSLAPAASLTQEPVVAQDSFSNRIAAGKVIIGVPALGQEALLSELRPGDVVDVFAILGGDSEQTPAAGRVADRATVLRQGGRSGAPLLLEVSADESLALAHLIGRDARLTYALLSSAPTSSPGPLRASGNIQAGVGGSPAPPTPASR